MAIDLNKLDALARAATQPGPWSVSRGPEGVAAGVENSTVLDAHGMWVADCGQAHEDAVFIAALDPATVLELVAEVRALRKKLRDVRIDL